MFTRTWIWYSVREHCPQILGREHQLWTELWMKRFKDLNWRPWPHNSLP